MLAILNPELERRGASRLETASLVGSLALLAIFVGAAAPVRRLPETPVPRAPEATGLMMQIQDSLPQQVVAPVPPHSEHPAATPMPAARPEPRPDPQPNAESNLASGVATHVMTTGPQQADDERAAVLAKTLRTDPSAGVRRVAAWGLNRYAQLDVAQDALVYAVGSDADATVREMAAWALAGARHSAAASAVIVRAIEKDRDASVRATAVWAAGSIGDASAVPALVGALKDADPDIREMAAWSIGVCRPEQAPAPLVSALADSEKDVRLSVAWALFRIRDPETTTAIDAAFRHETDADVREGLIRALGQMGDRSVDALQRLLSSPDSAVRTVAVAALAGGEAGGPWPWPRPQPRPFP